MRICSPVIWSTALSVIKQTSFRLCLAQKNGKIWLTLSNSSTCLRQPSAKTVDTKVLLAMQRRHAVVWVKRLYAVLKTVSKIVHSSNDHGRLNPWQLCGEFLEGSVRIRPSQHSFTSRKHAFLLHEPPSVPLAQAEEDMPSHSMSIWG